MAPTTGRSLPTVKIGNEDYYFDGDILLHQDDLNDYDAVTLDVGGIPAEELLAQTAEGKVARWKPGMVLSYYVLRSSFPDDKQYGEIVRSIEAAADAWQGACGVEFKHETSLDKEPDPTKVVFTVVQENANGRFLAAAFFPTWAKTQRRVIIDPTFFTDRGPFKPEGILRHELGHVLGFRHEHIRNAAAAAALGIESTSATFDLTAYDEKSVMHYANQKFGNQSLEITHLDRLGAQRIYGLPRSQVTFVE